MAEKNNKKTITEDIVRYVADLSRLELGEKDIAHFKEQLSAILDYIAQLEEVDTDGVQPTTHAIASMKNVFREDKLGESLSQEEALSNAPAKYNNFFKVPKIIKNG